MQRLFRRNRRPPPGRGRGPARWTAYEVALIVLSLLLIVFPLYAEAYRWLNPLVAPAAPRAQEAPTDATPATEPTVVEPAPAEPAPAETALATDATPAAEATAPVEPAAPRETNTAGPTVTDTVVAPPATGTATATATTDPALPTATATATTDPALPTATATATTDPALPTGTATNTASPTVDPAFSPTPSLTPALGEPPLTLVKTVSESAAQPGQPVNFTVSVFSNNGGPTPVEVRDTINPQLEIVSASASNGSCSVSGNTVICNVNAQAGGPATISITVRVRDNATPGARLANQALAQDARQFSASSDQVFVEVIGGTTNPPTATSGPAQPSATPGAGTVVPTAVPPGGQPGSGGGGSDTSSSGGSGGSGGGGGSGSGADTLPPVLLPPTPDAVQPLPPTPRPVRPGGGGGGSGGGAAATSAPAASPSVAPPTADGLYFRMASDWGSAFPGQAVNYVIRLDNTRSTELRDVVIRSDLPANVTVLSATLDLRDGANPAALPVSGNRVSAGLASLAPNKGVYVTISTGVKDTVSTGTRVVAQADLTFAGLSIPAYSNIVTVLVVGPPSAAQGPASPTVSASTSAITGTAQLAATSPAGSIVMPTAETTPAEIAAAGTAYPAPGQPTATTAATPATATATVVRGAPPAAPPAAPLPNTSTGIPLLGIAMLGATMGLRTWRLHRAKERL
jgi:uncharacterized repeat protein (TIGR01451 family)